MNILSFLNYLKNRYLIAANFLWSIIYRSSFKQYGAKSTLRSPLGIEGPQFISIGRKVAILDNAWLMALNHIPGVNPELNIGDGTYIGHYSHIVAVKKVHIGNKVLVADKVYISDNLREYQDILTPVIDQPVIFKGEVVIGDGSWIGESVSIIGSNIGKHCVIAANSVVTNNIPDFSVAAGSPAKIIKRYNSKTRQWDKTKSDGVFLNE